MFWGVLHLVMRFEDWWECEKTHREESEAAPGEEEGPRVSHGTVDSVRTQHSALNSFGSVAN